MLQGVRENGVIQSVLNAEQIAEGDLYLASGDGRLTLPDMLNIVKKLLTPLIWV